MILRFRALLVFAIFLVYLAVGGIVKFILRVDAILVPGEHRLDGTARHLGGRHANTLASWLRIVCVLELVLLWLRWAQWRIILRSALLLLLNVIHT